MDEDPVWDKAKGELRIWGRRHTAVDAQALCEHLDSLVGEKVAETIMHNLESRLGKEDVRRTREERPQASVSEVLDLLIKSDLLSGAGVTKVVLPENETGDISLEVANPSVRGSSGAAKAFLFSWWSGALTALLGRDLDVADVAYDEGKNLLRGRLVQRLAK